MVGWAFMVARGVGNAGLRRPTTGDHKGPPLVHPTALAPTETSIEAKVDASWASLADAFLSTDAQFSANR